MSDHRNGLPGDDSVDNQNGKQHKHGSVEIEVTSNENATAAKSSDLLAYRQLYNARLAAAKAHKEPHDLSGEHPWVRSARLAKLEAERLENTDDSVKPTAVADAPAIYAIVSAVCLVLCVTLILGVLFTRPHVKSPTETPRPKLIVWHAGSDTELVQLQQWAHAFSQLFDAQVTVETRTDLTNTLIPAVMTGDGPTLAIVPADLAHRLYTGGALLPINAVQEATTENMSDNKTKQEAAFTVQMAPNTPWTRAQVLVVPRSNSKPAMAYRFARFIADQIVSATNPGTAKKP